MGGPNASQGLRVSGRADVKTSGSQLKPADPFVGWRPFKRADSGRFFGRETEAEVLRSLWTTNRVTLLHGPSSVGKTSLLRAGILPLIAGDTDFNVLPPATIRAGRRIAATRDNSGRVTDDLLKDWDPQPAAHETWTSIAEFVRAQADFLSADPSSYKVLASIDQFERVFDISNDDQRVLFEDLKLALLRNPQLNLLILIQDDWIENIEQMHLFSSFGCRYFKLNDLAPGSALDALTRPLHKLGYRFADALANDLVAELASFSASENYGTGSEADHAVIRPLFLQVMAVEIFSHLPAPPVTISQEMLRRYADLDHALASFYDSAIGEVCQSTGEPESRLRAWIETTFITKTGGVRRVQRGTLLTAGVPNLVCDAFVELHILNLEQHAQRTCYLIENERLARIVLTVNREWTDALAGRISDDVTSGFQADKFERDAQDALLNGDVPTAERLAALAAAQYDNVGDLRRFAHALLLKGDVACVQGHLKSAENNYRSALSTFSILQDRNLTAKSLSALAEVSALAEDFDRAAQLQQLAIDYLPTDVNALIGLAYAQWYGGSPADAEATFTQALTWDPNAARAWVGRGQVRADMEEYDLALADIERALECALSQEDQIDVMSARALALAGVGRSTEGEQELAVARGRDPQRPRTLLRSARLAAMHGESQDAVRELEQGLEGRPPLSPREQEEARRLLVALGSRPS